MADYNMAHHKTYWAAISIILVILAAVVALAALVYFTFKSRTGI